MYLKKVIYSYDGEAELSAAITPDFSGRQFIIQKSF